jgi:hypothetical protein
VFLAISEVRGIVARACARPDVLHACSQRDLGAVIVVLKTLGVTQGQISELTGISQGRLSEYATGARKPRSPSVFESFASGLAMPSAARDALGLPVEASDSTGLVLARSRKGQLDANVGLEYPDTPSQAAVNVSALWNADLDDQQTVERGLVTPAAWSEASLRWLVAPAAVDARTVSATGRVQVGMSDVERFRDTVGMFRELDNRFGGGHARDTLIQYLRNDAVRLLRGRYSDGVGSVLLSAVADATQLAAWMTYDSTPHSPQAQKYFIQALGLAQAAGDRLLGAGILDSMSHQATYTGRFREAANLAQAARFGTAGVATASLTAHFHAMEARAMARLGEAKACEMSLAAAMTEYERRRPEDDPDWFQYFDEAELSAEFGHCLRDLGRSADAAEYAGRSVGATSDGRFARSDFFATMVLADAHLAAGDAEQACATALVALAVGEKVRSGRCVSYLREFREHLVVAEGAAAVRDFGEQAVRSRMWRIASRPSGAAAVA